MNCPLNQLAILPCFPPGSLSGRVPAPPPYQAPSLVLQFDPDWNFQSVIFQVERTLFSVWKSGFLVKGTPFEAMFSLPTGDATEIEGSSPKKPIILEGVAVEDFKVFLRVLYPSGVLPLTHPSEWLGVLRLAHKWEFVEIRKRAVGALATYISAKPAKEKISMAYQFLVQDWLKQGLIDIVLDKNLEIDHLRQSPCKFDQESIIKLFYIQSKAWQKQSDKLSYNPRYYYMQEPGYYYMQGHSFDINEFVKGSVEKMFAKELRKAAYNH